VTGDACKSALRATILHGVADYDLDSLKDPKNPDQAMPVSSGPEADRVTVAAQRQLVLQLENRVMQQHALPAICAELGIRDIDGVAGVNSRDLARNFGKRHDHVLRDVDNVLGDIDHGAQLPTQLIGPLAEPCRRLSRRSARTRNSRR
jgi:hypothetical protein